MFNRRFFPYIIVLGFVGLLLVCYVGFRAYQKHVEFKTFMSNAQALNRSVAHGETHEHVHIPDEHTHGRRNQPHSHLNETESDFSGLFTGGQSPSSVENGSLTDGYSGVDRHKMFMDWIDTGKKSDAMEAFIKESQANNPFRGKVIQRIVTPNGQIHTVLVPEGYEYQEGDAILRSELDPPTQVFSFGGDPMKLILNGIEHEVPGYHVIADPYKREEYFNKFMWSIKNSVSMEEVEKKVRAGELDFSLSEIQKRGVDLQEERRERAQWLSGQFAKPLPPDRPPVKVRYLPDEAEDALPGWLRKLERNPWPKRGTQADAGKYSAVDTVFEGDSSLDTTLVRPNDPLSPSDLSTPFESEAASQSEVMPGAPQTAKPPTAESHEIQLREQLSPERFSKAQQLIEQYGAEDGLRRLRQADPDAARQFERQRSTPPTRSEPDTR